MGQDKKRLIPNLVGSIFSGHAKKGAGVEPVSALFPQEPAKQAGAEITVSSHEPVVKKHSAPDMVAAIFSGPAKKGTMDSFLESLSTLASRKGTELVKLKEELGRKEEELSKIKKELEIESGLNASLNKNIADLNIKISGLDNNIVTLTGAVSDKEAELSAAKEKLDTQARINAELKNNIAGLSGAVSAIEAHLSAAKEDLSVKTAELDSARKDLEKQASLNDSASSNIAELKSAVAAKEGELVKAKEELSGEEAQLAALKDELSGKKAELTKLKEDLPRFIAAVDAKESELSGAKRDLAAKEAEIFKVKGELEKQIVLNESLNKDIAELNKNIAGFAAKIAAKENIAAELTMVLAKEEAESGWIKKELAGKESGLAKAREELAVKDGELNRLRQELEKSVFSRFFRRASPKKAVPAKKGKGSLVLKEPQKKALPVGIDIGTSSVKIVRLRPGPAPEVEKIIVEEIPRDAQEDLSKRPQVLADILKRMVQEHNLKGDCFACLPHTMSKVSLITLPQMSASEIEKALRWEIKQTTQMDLNDISLDYIALEHQKAVFSPNQLGILAITTSKKESMQYLGLLKSAGLNALALDTQVLANFAALEYVKAIEPDKAVLFLDFAAGQASLSIINNAELIFTRMLNATGNALTKAIAQYCRLSWEEAEAAKKGLDLAGFGSAAERASQQDKSLQVRNAVLPLLENMVQDIEHALKYFSLQVARSQISRFDKMILSGGSSNMKSLGAFLSSRLNMNVEMNTALSKFTIKDAEYEGAGSTALGARLNAALGLALRGL